MRCMNQLYRYGQNVCPSVFLLSVGYVKRNGFNFGLRVYLNNAYMSVYFSHERLRLWMLHSFISYCTLLLLVLLSVCKD